ncbi:zf-HC2 domain-containing protein [Aquincola sp. S2]|uniref:Zf-HC2 domain-containing protein n=1 Tax=Pseudaquabacterium terrae TaxID=2732868 RepID=A0ABX2EQA1_9BURK|nr:zf-HC2 domain-containing protein [Aquabacterium terrae]NRF70659.1 zf-HC2 domain-containing protein [Aquabacterium terrae]
MKLRRTCKEVTRLVLESEDRSLSAVEKIALQFHWRACEACTRFREQARTMRRAMDRWRSYRDEG